jgi:pyruvate,water dikinase
VSKTLLWFSEIGQPEASAVGGKGLNLGLMSAAGLPVPPGFVITAEAYRAAGGAMQDFLRIEILAAYDRLGGGLVAVRSSATAEDGAEASFAGQQETILGVEGHAGLIAAIERCWHSLHTERAVAYRREQKIDEAGLAMAVVVQQLVPADVAGVLFTHNPLDATGRSLAIEAAPGLGEAVVSGRVMPDRFLVDRESHAVIEQQISTKRERLDAGGWRPLPEAEQTLPSLSNAQLAELAVLAAKIEAYYGEPRDVEWALVGGQFFILQARPITTISAADVEAARQAEIARVQALAGGKEIIWARYNLAEVLPTPTPLTWSIVKHFMSGRGGFGRMFRDLRYDPDPALDEDGFIDLICGRPYVNLDREPLLFYRDFPYGYDYAAIRQDPARGMYPQLVTVASRKTSRFWWRLPSIVWAMLRSSSRTKALMASEAKELTEKVYPEFVAKARAFEQLDFTSFAYDDLFVKSVELMLAIDLFAARSLRPGVFAATALAELEGLLKQTGATDPAADARRLVMGVHPPPESDLAGALRKLATGQMSREAFLKDFGHRGPQEMELSQPRYSEAPQLLPQATSTAPSHEQELVALEAVIDLKKHAGLRPKLEAALQQARTYLALRESSKHYLMLGFAQLRRLLRALGQRLGIGDDVFYLDALPSEPSAPDALAAQAKANKCRRQLWLAIASPPVLFSDDLEALGRPVQMTGMQQWQGTPLSLGSFEGPALVLDAPIPAEGLAPGFVLVCPSTDPAWVPLFLKAGALVMESGGVLSHGAIVAREFGIPAVAGIADVPRLIETGQRVHVDGASGRIALI